MILRCENPHPHFKDRTCNAKAAATCDLPGQVVVNIVCHRCNGPIEFVFENEPVLTR